MKKLLELIILGVPIATSYTGNLSILLDSYISFVAGINAVPKDSNTQA